MRLDNCGSCVLFRKNSLTCAMSNRKKDPIYDYCSEHRFTLYQCCICGRVPENAVIDFDGNEYSYACKGCLEELIND